MSEELYAVIIQAKEEKYRDGSICTKDGQLFWVINGEWAVSSEKFHPGNAPDDLKIFNTYGEAEEFAKQWGGHPWWCNPNGKFYIVKVIEKYKKVFDGYTCIDGNFR